MRLLLAGLCILTLACNAFAAESENYTDTHGSLAMASGFSSSSSSDSINFSSLSQSVVVGTSSSAEHTSRMGFFSVVLTIPPEVSSIDRVAGSSNPTNASSVDYTVTFSEDVSGIDSSDFVLAKTGTANGSIASVSAASGDSVTVTVNTITGDGTLGLNLSDDDTILNSNGVPLGTVNGDGSFTGQTYTVDNTDPAVSVIDLATASDSGSNTSDNQTNDTTPSVEFTAESGSSLSIDWGDGAGFVALGSAGTGAAQQSTLTTAYTSDGSKTIQVKSTDTAGNTTTQTLSITLDRVAPLATLTPSNNANSVALTTDLTLTFNEAMVKGTSGNVVIKQSSDDSVVESIAIGDAKVTLSDGDKIATVNPSSTLLKNTAYYISVESGVFTDVAGNAYAGIASDDKATWNFRSVVNVIPTLTAFSSAIVTTPEDTLVEIKLSDLIEKGNQLDSDGNVNAFVVTELSTGTLRIGANVLAAASWNAASNNRIDASNSAFWMPENNANGNLDVFEVAARDNDGADSSIAVQATATVSAVNDAPSIAGVSISGNVIFNQLLTVSADGFSDPDTGDTAGEPIYQWHRATDASCVVGKADITGASGNTYTVTSDEVGKYVCVTITPRDNSGLEGDAKTGVTEQVVAQASQAITFNLATTQLFTADDTFNVAATGGNSSEAVVITSGNEAVCTVDENTVTMVSLGLCTLTASQEGNANYAAPESVSKTVYLTNPAPAVTDTDTNNDGVGDTLESTFGSEDEDMDGIPDALEALAGADIDASTDTDGDGTPDVIEILNGRDPTVDDSSAVGAPVVTMVDATKNLLSKGTLSVYTTMELTVSAEDGDTAIIPVAYYALGACKGSVPYNYQAVCTQVPETGYVSGTHSVWWLVVDSDNNWGKAKQTLNILPQISFNGDLILAGIPGTGSVSSQLVMSGPAIDAAESNLLISSTGFVVPFTISGEGSADHDLIDGAYTIRPGAVISDPVVIKLGSAPTNGNEVVITLDSSGEGFAQSADTIDIATHFATAGSKTTQTVTISQNVTYPPRLSALKGKQGVAPNEVQGLVFDKSQGDITISFSQLDPDSGSYSYSWAGSDIVLGLSGEAGSTALISQSSLDLAAGRYYIEVHVTDSTAPNSEAAVLGGMLTLVEASTLSTTSDIDGDGKTDAEEGLSDSDGDGRPDYLDAQNLLANVVPTDSAQQQRYLVTTKPGLRIIFGKTAIAAQSGDTKIAVTDLESYGNNGQSVSDAYPVNASVDHLFDYEVENMEVPVDPLSVGNTVQVVLPLNTLLTADSAFIKYDTTNGWRDFVVNSDNQIAWTTWQFGIIGNCPESGSSSYSDDLSQKEGANCLQVTIQDGGPNDADGVVNGRIIDPLGIATTGSNVTIVTENDGGSGGGSVGFLEWLLGLTLLIGLWIVRRRLFEPKAVAIFIKGEH